MRILIVEDEAQIRVFLARAFEAEGFAVDVVEDGEHGLSCALGGSYDLVILDLLLPGCDGLGVLRELHRQRSELPVLILSARSDLATKLRGFELGAVDYVAKPFSLDELLARARVQLRRAAVADDGNVIRVGRLVLDLTGRQARVGETVADLSDREFRVLYFLMLHVGQVISRERLLSEIWGYDFDPALGSQAAGFTYDTAHRRIIVSYVLARGRAGDPLPPAKTRLRRLRPLETSSRPPGQAAEASGARLAYSGDPVFETLGVDRGVDRGGADIGVASELADHADVDASVGQGGTEGVAQHVR